MSKKGRDEDLLRFLRARGAAPVIPDKINRKQSFLFGPGDWNDIVALREQPGKRELADGAAIPASFRLATGKKAQR